MTKFHFLRSINVDLTAECQLFTKKILSIKIERIKIKHHLFYLFLNTIAPSKASTKIELVAVTFPDKISLESSFNTSF